MTGRQATAAALLAGILAGGVPAFADRSAGARAISVPGPKSPEYYKPFANPRKFEGVLPVLWREGDDTVYGVPARSDSLAHVMAPGDLVHRPR